MKSLNRILVVTIIGVCLFINPYGFDIYTNSRMASLLFFSSLILGIMLFNLRQVLDKKYKNIFYISTFFFLSILSSLLFSGIDIFDGLMGVYGRSIGALTYISLLILFFAAVISATISNSVTLLKSLIYLGIVTAAYGLIQYFDLDPILTTKTYNPVKGFLGNPNFQSSFLGIAAVAVVSFILSKNLQTKYRFFLLSALTFFLFIAYLTDSTQGFIVFIIGLYYLVFAKLRSSKSTEKLSLFMVIISPIVFVLLILDLLQKSPWSSILYENSISYRGDFWRAGLSMFMNNPIFGIGPDGYRDEYRLYRDSVAANRIENRPPINSAHNIFIEMGATGGVPLLLSYILMVLLTFIAIWKLSIKFKEYNSSISGLIACWLGFMAQAIISVNTIPLSIIGWVFAGRIIGLRIGVIPEGKNLKIRQRLPQILVIPLATSSLVGLPLVSSDVNFRNALRFQDSNQIELAAYRYPANVQTAGLVAEIFRNANQSELATQIARDATKMNPKNYEAWEELYQSENLSSSEKAYVLSILKKLDPLNKELR